MKLYCITKCTLGERILYFYLGRGVFQYYGHDTVIISNTFKTKIVYYALVSVSDE